ncbi:MAG: hypothetical protein HQ519_00090 [Planctomycetes bacterium]|nr:hypothetical protein [Planctomycetota bacterium]
MKIVRNIHPRKQPIRVSGFATVPHGGEIAVPDDVAAQMVKEGRFELVKKGSQTQSSKQQEPK